MSSEDIQYFRARAIEERQRAAQVSRDGIAQIHLDLAEKYEALARSAGANSNPHPDWSGSRLQAS